MSDQLPRDLEGPLLALWTDPEHIHISMLPRDTWMAVACLQFASRNPALRVEQRSVIEQLARALQGVLAQRDPIIGKYLEMGWDSQHDEPTADPPF